MFSLCSIFEILADGALTGIPGGTQPVLDGFRVYGSCTYRSPRTGKRYLFVNGKSARYWQYELTVSANGTLETTL